jgi:hypothetical protein
MLTDEAFVIREWKIQHERNRAEDDEVENHDQDPPVRAALRPRPDAPREAAKQEHRWTSRPQTH